ncbi:MAG TPA: hypothetical protein VMU27_02585 [Candidatus Paceibacterota bacterium]|nr:hypothetical protein [Candidatus Paceibacterota bacterium]
MRARAKNTASPRSTIQFTVYNFPFDESSPVTIDIQEELSDYFSPGRRFIAGVAIDFTQKLEYKEGVVICCEPIKEGRFLECERAMQEDIAFIILSVFKANDIELPVCESAFIN